MTARVGILGGTFDPLHFGHLVAASAAVEQLELNRLVLVPAGQPWQKSDRSVSPAEDRYVMAVLATVSDPRLEVSRAEIDRDGPTYTIDTLRQFRAELGTDLDLFFIAGADAINGIATWREADRLPELATFVALNRPGHELSVAADFTESIRSVRMPLLEISATDLRERARAGRSLRYLVPDVVADYVIKRGLYR